MIDDPGTSHAQDRHEAALKMDYEQTLATWRMLVDLRFRLLAFVPAIAGVLIALGNRSRSATSALVALLGLAALFGIIMYDLRNSQFHDAVIHRAKELEKALVLSRLSDKGAAGGLMNERPRDRYRLAGVEVWHDRALFVVYAASAAGLAAVGVLGFAVVFRVLHRCGSQVKQPLPIPPSPGP